MVESEKTAIAKQQLVKHVPAATDLGQRHIHCNDFLEERKTLLKPSEAVMSIRFSRRYEVLRRYESRSTAYGGRVECLHRSPASRRSRL
jgi:hypothetical protein